MRALLLSSAVLLGIAALPAPAQDRALPDGVVALVNGEPVSSLSVDTVLGQLQNADRQADRDSIIDELINLSLLTDEAERLDLNEDPTIAAALDLQYKQTMANAFLATISEQIDITEDDLRAEYDRQAAGVDSSEYRVSHILVESEADAQAVIDALAAGESFESLAASRSIDPSGEDGGELGWMTPGATDPAFAAAMAGLQTGQSSTSPVQTDYGWHVLRLLDKRGTALPDFQSVKSGLRNLVLRSKLETRIDALRQDAEIVR